MLLSVSDPVLQVLDTSQRLQGLRQRLDQLDAERATIQAQIADCMEQLASAVGGQVMPPTGSRLAAQILWVLRRHQERPLAPLDIAEILNLRSFTDLTNVRVLLSRMSRDGRVRKVGRARYLTL
jgi:hypothetical protein